MRAASAGFAARVGRGARSRLEVTSWLGSRNLGTIDVADGSWSVEDAADQQVPGSIRFDVPNVTRWRPLSPTHPLAGMGQQVTARIGIDVGSEVEWLPAGRFRLEAPQPASDVITVTGRGLLDIVERARLLAPFKSTTGQTRTAVLQRLIGGLLPWQTKVTSDTMGAFVCERERLEGIREIADAWPARIAVTDTGILQFLPPWNDDNPGPAVVELVDGPTGTLVEISPQRDTSSMFNGYSVSTVPQGDAQPVTESWVIPSGPLAWNGPYGQFPGFFASPTLPADRTRLRAVAQTLTLRAQRRRDAYEVTAAPDARVQVGDIAHVRSTRNSIDIVGRVTRVTHTATALRCTVAYLSGARP